MTITVDEWAHTARVVPIWVDEDRALVPPDDIETLGIWADGPLPGSGRGTVALVVHRDSAEKGSSAFARLEDLPRSATVVLDGRTYRLARSTIYRKATLPAEDIFRLRGPERLVIVTCGGDFTPGVGYDSNVVSVFKPVAA